MFRTHLTLVTTAALVLCGSALAQPNIIHNPGFETVDPFNPTRPEGWQPFNSARHRVIGDGLGDILVHGGDASIELASGADFVGYTTDTFDPFTGDLFNPKFVHDGGRVRICGWYAIPADQPLVDANTGLKLEFRRENFSIYQSFEDLSITGDTDGEWVQLCFDVLCDDISPDFPPFATNVAVLPIRFGSASSTGTVFWDDLSLSQCLADFNCDDLLNTSDFIAFLNAFTAQGPGSDFNMDGIINTSDFIAFLNAFTAGCEGL